MSTHINDLIQNISPETIATFFKRKMASFGIEKEDFDYLLNENQFEKFSELQKLGKATFSDTDELLVLSAKYNGELTERSSKKAQYDIAKKVLKEDFKDGAVFIFYDAQGCFRFSFLRKNYGKRTEKFTPWRRFTYFVSPHKQNKTFVSRMDKCTFANLDAIQEAFSVEPLSEQFYKDLSHWYFWSLTQVEFPKIQGEDIKTNHTDAMIRLITRLMFVWFMKQKKLVPDELFDWDDVNKIINFNDKTGSTYYKAILQNLFFATLNIPMGKDRKFVNRQTGEQVYYRYKRFIKNEELFFALMNKIPFLNGGLFENLDIVKPEEGIDIRIDCFSNMIDNETKLKVPDSLFFGEHQADISKFYEKETKVNVSGIIDLLNRYDFTIDENTPYDQEVALDPELLGMVFENLLASYNPETQSTARRQTGSFYTPRQIVNFMVDESLKSYLLQISENFIENDDRINKLFYDCEYLNEFSDRETDFLVRVLSEIKILDPACGSGAFPMGILHRMVDLLKKLDADNERWNNLQIERAIAETTNVFKSDYDTEERELRLEEINKAFDLSMNYPDYARKLFLIENCIYGVDIQQIAIQISKLRFFISLIVDQKVDDSKPNRNILSMPNLETKFVAANALINLEKPKQRTITTDDVEKHEIELTAIRRKIFFTRKYQEKKKLKKKEENERMKLRSALIDSGFGEAIATQMSEWNPFDPMKSASFFDPETMFGLSKNKFLKPGSYQNTEITLLNKQIEAVNKQIESVNTSLKFNQDESILRIKLITASLQTSIIEIEVKNISSKVNDLYGSIDKSINNVVKEKEDITYMVNALNKSIKKINAQISQLENELKPLVHNDEGVFDIIIGNPPYIKEYTHKNAFDGLRTSPYYQGKMDIWYFFACKNLDYLKKKTGLLCFIATNNWTTNAGASKMRTKVINDATILKMLDFGSYMIFESADIQTMVMLFRNKTSNNEYHFELRRLTGNDLVFDDVLNLLAKNETEKTEYLTPKIFKEKLQGKTLTFCNDVFEDILHKISLRANFFLSEQEVANGIHPHYDYVSKATRKKLGSLFRVGQGIFVLSNDEKESLNLNKEELKLIKPYYTTNQLHKWYGNAKNEEWIIYTDSKFKKSEYMRPFPNIKQHLDKFQLIITSDNKPYGLHRAREEKFFKDEKIIVLRKCSNQPIFTYTDFDCYVSATFYVIKSGRIDLKYLTAILNSKLIAFWLRNKGKMQGNNYQLDKEPLLNIPIYKANNVLPFSTIVDQIISAKKNNDKADIANLETQIDLMVYKLYELSYEEVLHIEPDFGMGREAYEAYIINY